MRPPDSLQIVIALRRQREEAEERALVSVMREIDEVREGIECCDRAVAAFCAMRVNGSRSVQQAWQHQQSEAQYRELQQEHERLRAKLAQLDETRAKQMDVYREARCEREVISELQARRASAYRMELQRREQKRDEDLYLSRRARS